MADFDWAEFAIQVVLTVVAIRYGMWLQRRKDRKAARRDLDEIGRRFAGWRGRDRG